MLLRQKPDVTLLTEISRLNTKGPIKKRHDRRKIFQSQLAGCTEKESPDPSLINPRKGTLI